MRSIFRDNIILFVRQFGISLLSFAATVILTRTLSPDAYGTYRYLLAIVGMIGAVSLVGMGTAITQAVARGKKGVLRHASRVLFRFSAAVSVGVILGALALILSGRWLLGLFLIFFAFLLPITSSSNAVLSFLNGKKRYSTLLIYSSISVFVVSLAMIVLALLGVHAYVLAAAWLALNTISLGLLYRFVRSRGSEEVSSVYASSDVVEYGVLLSVITLPATLLSYVERLLVFHVLGAPALALYSISLTFPDQMRGVAKNIQSVALPIFSSKEGDSDISAQLRASFLILGAGGIALFLLIPWLYGLFFPQYIQGALYARLFVLIIGIEALASVFLSFLRARRATRFLFILNVMQAFVGIPLLVYGLIAHGMPGLFLVKGILSVLTLLLAWLTARHVAGSSASPALKITHPLFQRLVKILS